MLSLIHRLDHNLVHQRKTYPNLKGIRVFDRLATFYSRSRKGRWCKGETSGNYIRVQGVYLDCDRDSVVYLGEPDGPSCHTVHCTLP